MKLEPHKLSVYFRIVDFNILTQSAWFVLDAFISSEQSVVLNTNVVELNALVCNETRANGASIFR